MAEGAGSLDILHAHGLTTDGIVGDGQDHERHVARILLQHLLQFLQRDVTLEGNFELGILGIVGRHVDSKSLAGLDMTLGRVEVGVARNDVAFLDKEGEEHVLGGTSLVGRDDIVEAENPADRLLKLIETRRTCVALVAQHHGGPLAVAHRSRTTIGKAVDIDLLGPQLEHIIIGGLQPLLTLCARTLTDGFNHLDLP